MRDATIACKSESEGDAELFETVAPARASRANRNVLYEALSFSLALHGIAAVVAVVSNVWQVRFPTASPSYTISFVLEAPPPPPPPAPPAKPLEQKPEITTAKIFMRRPF